jgi:divalent metal cation (Fe/Co/Zn/Cd) transporter
VTASENALYSRAYAFAAFVCVYNIAEGIVAILFGYKDESLSLFGFGVDSFIEVASNSGVLYMINRIRQFPDSSRTPFEKTALTITGYGFYALSVTLAVGAVLSVIQGHKPHTTFWGIVISCISIGIMYYVARSQIKTGEALQSQAIISDARCTIVCIYMSVVLLLSSFIYEVTGFAYADAIGAVGIIYFSIVEGKEALEKAKGNECCSHH